MTKRINEPSDLIAASIARWKLNRDMIAGEYAVKRAGEAYLSKLPTQSDADYRNYLNRTPFFPGAGRTHDGLLGLVTRKPGAIEIPAGLAAIFDTITSAGDTVFDLAEDVFSETLKTGYTGMLVDHPTSASALTLADAEAQNLRPFVSVYQAESILEVTPGVVSNRRKIVRVRLLENNGETVRELVLDDGIYAVILHNKINGLWVADAPVVPTRNGQPLTDIPFVLVTPKARAFEPVKGPMDDVCLLNGHCYRAQADAKMSRFYSSAPQLATIGAKMPESLVMGPGTMINIVENEGKHPVQMKFIEWTGAGQSALDSAVADHKDEMAKLGSNILASEKSAAEAAETHAIRRSSENAVLGSLARTVGRKIEEALRLVAAWMGYDEKTVSFELNTDFVPTPMTSEERKAALAEFMSGAISYETYIDMMISGEVLPDSFDVDDEKQRLAVDSANVDRPTTTTTEDPPVE